MPHATFKSYIFTLLDGSHLGFMVQNIRNGHGSALPNMNGIEIPDPYCESELRQRLGITTNKGYAIFGKPRASLKLTNPSFFLFSFLNSSFRCFKLSPFRNAIALPTAPFSTNGLAIRGALGGAPWWRVLANILKTP